VADRDGGEVVLLDPDLLVIQRLRVPWPTQITSRAGGGLWVVCATQGNPRGPHELRRLAGGLDEGAALEVAPVIDLESDPEGGVWLLTAPPGGAPQLQRLAVDGTPEVLPAPSQARRLALSGARVAIAARTQGLLLLEEGSRAWESVPDCEGLDVLDVAADGSGGWWLLARADLPGSEHALHLDASLRVLAEVPCQDARALAVGGGLGMAPWVLGPRGAWVQRLVAPSPRSQARVSLSARGAETAVLDGRGGLLLAACGALLRLGPDGWNEPGQGGFECLVDVAAYVPP